MKALLVIDMQNDFITGGGALAVPGGNEIIQPILNLMLQFKHRIATLDWHPKNHCSFTSLWPPHCIQGTHGADFAPGFSKDQFEKIIHKGTDPSIDSYSAFYDNDHKTSTGLTAYLRSHHLTHITIVGVALDYCVYYSALGARKDGFEVTVILSLTRSIDPSPSNQKKIISSMEQCGVNINR